ncbi:GGDEF domain-containing protein [Lichenibacterium dinghuense]|uniref:GGDEF domain-containing protein n=1 Tax=Lichenibacterium dinghuense TaxID=2895977 RepID=UPI001F2AFF22|nr:GGDEF domain-containing protein [Lichenibacterium sp. 6Y81]
MIDVELIGAPAFTVAVAGDVFTYASINGRLADVIGVAPSAFVGQTPDSLLSADYAAAVLGHYRRCVAERVSVDFESFYDAPGGGRWWHTTVTPVLDPGDGRVALLVGLGVDITPRKDAERLAREVDQRIALAMDLLEGGFWHYTIASHRFSTSPQLSRLVAGDGAGPLDGPGYAAFVLPEDQGATDFGALVRGEADALSAEYRVRTADGRLRWMSCQRRLTRDEAGRPENIVGVVVDITDQKLRHEALAAEAATDSLTELANRRSFEAQGGRMAAEARADGAFGLVLLDLDRFKPVNDTHGHAVGDAVLREVAARLRRHLRPGDVAARLGGDEFAVLLPGATEDVLAGLSRRLVEAVGRPVATVAGRVEIGASAGAALWRTADRTLAALVERADAELFAVKRGGRGAWRVAA